MPGIKLPYIKLHIPFLFSLKTKISMQLSREEATALKKCSYFNQLLFTALPCIYLQEEGQTRESKEEKGAYFVHGSFSSSCPDSSSY